MEPSNAFITKRKFTDVICGIAFVAFLLLMAYMSIWGYAKGDLDNIAVPFDSSGNACGRGDRKDFPHLFVSLVNDEFSIDKSVCIKECPKKDSDTVECVPNDDLK